MKSGIECLQSFVVNLDNFESPEAINSPYVLTSPRSLKACKKAGIKPVELLYKTCQEIATELGISVNHVRNIHQQQETERHRKLDLCRKVRDELKNKPSRFHFFQRKPQTNKYIHKCNNAKQKARVTLVTDSDESWRNSPTPHLITSDYNTNRYPSSLPLTNNHSKNATRTTIKSDILRNHTNSYEVDCRNNTNSYKVDRQNHSSSHEVDRQIHTNSHEVDRQIHTNSHEVDRQSLTNSHEVDRQSLTNSHPVSSPKSFRWKSDHTIRQYNPDPVRKHSNPDYPPVQNVTRQDEQMSSRAAPPLSLQLAANSPNRTLERYLRKKPSCNVEPPITRETKHKKYESSDGCASVSSLTPDPVLDSYPSKVDKPVASIVQDPGKDSEHGNTSTTSSDKENKKISRRFKLKSKDVSRKNHSLPIKFQNNEENQKPPGEEGEGGGGEGGGGMKKRLRFKKETSVNSDSSSSASSKRTTASSGDLRRKYKTKMKQLPDLSHVSLLSRSTAPEGFYNQNISYKDRRILESLALKKQEEIEMAERAVAAHRKWEEDRKSLDRKQEEKREKWRCFVEEKRKQEGNINTMRMEEVKENLRRAQSLLEERLIERDKRIQDAIHQTEHKKIKETCQRKEHSEKRRFLVEANHLQRELERIIQYEECEHELNEKLKRAEKLRQMGLRNFHRKVASTNKLEELKHQERMEELLEEDKYMRNQKVKELHEREDRVIQRYMEQVRHKLKAIKRNSMTRELKSQQAKQTVRDLEEGLETWQDHVMLMQWDALRRSEANAKLLIANRRLRVECENKERMIQHSRRFREKKMDDSRKLRSIIEEIRNKEEKIKCLQRTRERDMSECRLRAHSAAELREQIRNVLTPETFDRKVSRVNMELSLQYTPLCFPRFDEIPYSTRLSHPRDV